MTPTIRLAFLALAYMGTLSAQPLTVDVQNLNFQNLPRVTFTTCISNGDTLLPGLDASHFILTENGVPQSLTIQCPEPGVFNSVMLVLDNSGSIASVLPKLVEAGSILVDSLGVNDEAAVMTFNQTPTVRQDFTTDKVALKNALTAMNASGGTALWDASYAACEALALQSGRRFAVILTDGEDTQSTLQTVDPIILLANAIQARLFTISFGITGSEAARNMKRMADETGGQYFDVQRPSELAEVYRQIASIITEPCCIGEYVSDNCADSVRTVQLSVDVNGMQGMHVQSVSTPFRPTQMRLRVEVPEELTPQQSGTGYIYLEPAPHPDLELSLSFTLRYNNEHIDITPPLPLSLGTITQNQLVTMTKVGPNEMRYTIDRIKPALPTNRLVGFPVQALSGDSLRIVDFTFKDSVYLVGCSAEFTLVPDTTIICPCFAPIDIDIPDPGVSFIGEEAEFEVSLPSGLHADLSARVHCEFRLPDGFTIVSVSNGGLFSPDMVEWNIGSDGWIYIDVPGFAMPSDTSGILVRIRAIPPTLKSAEIRELSVREAIMWHTCCPGVPGAVTQSVAIDGLCDKIVRRRAAANIAVSPNPVRSSGSMATIHVQLNESHPGGDYTLVIVDLYGKEVLRVAETHFAPGNYSFMVETSKLPSGTYKAVLQNDAERISDTMIILR